MFTTIFSKNLAIYLCIIIISFTALGTSLATIYRSYFIERQEETLTQRSEILAEWFFERELLWPFNIAQIIHYQELIDVEARNLREYLGYTFLIVDRDFRLVSMSEGVPFSGSLSFDAPVLIPIQNVPGLDLVMEGETVSIDGTLGGFFNEAMLTIAHPIGNEEIVIGAILMSTSMHSVNENISEVVRITVRSIVLSCVAAIIMIYFSSRHMTKSLKQMNEAAKVIASGDFEKRIEVKSLDEIGQLAESFNNMAEGLNTQEAGRRDFVANISHDLRSPLTSIIGFLEAMKDGTIPEERQGYYLNIVLTECKRLAKIANDLLDISKIDLTGALEIMREDFELNTLVRDTMIQFENRIRQKTIEADISFAEETTVVSGDYEKIQRVLHNLLDNAIKFTPENGRVRIETTIKDKKALVSVRDSGRGLSDEERRHIFDRFYKSDSSRGIDKTGSGLGLAIVWEFIKAHDEKISVESAEGVGCNFMFTLKLSVDEKGRRVG